MDELFNNGTTIVTSSTLKHRAQSYPIRTISKVTDFKMPTEIKNFILNGILGILGLAGIFSFKTIWVILGLIAAGIGGYNVYDIITRAHFMVIVEFSNGERLEFDFPKAVLRLGSSVINKALSLN